MQTQGGGVSWRKEGGKEGRHREDGKKREKDFYIPPIQKGNSEDNSIDSIKYNKILRNKLNQGRKVYTLKILQKRN